MSKIWCGIPVYNNAGTIVDIARRCREQLPHVLVIDDGSTDADLTLLLEPLDVKVIRHRTNQGKGRALQSAFDNAAENGAEYLVALDGDGQHLPEDIPRFFPHLSPDTILIGDRDEVIGQMPRSSEFGRMFSDFWVQLQAGGNPRDTQSGFRAYPLAAVRKLQLKSRFYNFEVEIVTRAIWAGLAIGSVPIRVWYPPADRRVSSFHPFRDNLRLSLLHTRLILRQILPIPHRKVIAPTSPLEKAGAVASGSNRQGSTLNPLNLAVSAAVAILMGIVLWPWGILPVAYVTLRLHLNKLIALLFVAIGTLPVMPALCNRIGRMVVTGAHPHWRWAAGSHLLAVPAALFAGWLVYTVARPSSQAAMVEIAGASSKIL